MVLVMVAVLLLMMMAVGMLLRPLDARLFCPRQESRSGVVAQMACKYGGRCGQMRPASQRENGLPHHAATYIAALGDPAHASLPMPMSGEVIYCGLVCVATGSS